MNDDSRVRLCESHKLTNYKSYRRERERERVENRWIYYYNYNTSLRTNLLSSHNLFSMFKVTTLLK